jgi:predicted nuclease with RNAse H fold
MRTVGIDFASKPKNTAICVIAWTDDVAQVESARSNVTDDDILALTTHVDRLGIDIPLGWPEAFAKAVELHVTTHAWPSDYEHDQNERYRFRRTDLWLRDQLGLPLPLSVSTDRIAIPAMRAAALLATMAPSALDGSGFVVEVYPAAALRQWDLYQKGYKRSENRAVREEILERIEEKMGGRLKVDADERDDLLRDNNVFDAFIASLVTRAHAMEKCKKIPKKDRQSALIEGWIAVPLAKSLEQLVA